MVDQVATIIAALVDMCRNTASELPPSILNNVATFSETLQKVLVFVRNQVGKSLIKRVVRHLEDASLLSECQLALDHAVQLFKLQCEVTAAASLAHIQAISTRKNSEFTNLVRAQASCSTLSTFHSRSSEISLLPGSPQIFHGRNVELQHIVSSLLHEDSTRIAILGPGGVGKSSLALAALYDHDVASKFESGRHFISCESSQSAGDIAAALFSHFALEGRGHPMKAILQHLSRRESPCVIVLDNLETPWEFPGGRSAVEDFLSHLSAIKTVYLIITMRGEERPMKVRWSRPFLRPLSPLSDHAAKQVFRDITDAVDNDGQVDELLRFTDNLPLAVTLMASLVSFEGASPVLHRWKAERLSVLSELSEGADKSSNLGTSIMMSLSSPRLTAIPDAVTLLRLLSVLPDGVTDSALAEMKLPLKDIALCRVTLCRTSLAYIDHDRLKALVPIREHMRAFHPPSPCLVSLLRDFFYQLVNLFCEKWARAVGSGLVQRLSADLGNIHSLLHMALEEERPPSAKTISCIIDLARFTEVTDLGSCELLRSISGVVEQLDDADLQGRYFMARSRIPNNMPPSAYMQMAIDKFEAANNVAAQAMAYHELSVHHLYYHGDNRKALQTCTLALTLARRANDHSVLARVLRRMSGVQHHIGNLRLAWAYTLEAQAHAQAAGDLETEFACMVNRVSHFITAGNYERAATLCMDLLSLAEGLGIESSDRGLHPLSMQAEIHFRKTEYVEARRINASLAESLRRDDGMRNATCALALYNTFFIDIVMGADVRHDSIPVFQRLHRGVHWTMICDIIAADLSYRQGDFTRADEVYSKCLAISRGQYAETTNECLQKLGDTAVARSQMDSALQYYVLHLAVSLNMDDFENTHQALRRLGDIFVYEGDDETARSLFTLSLEGFTLMDVHRARADCLFRLGEMWRRQGDGSNAARCWEQALPLFERSSQKDAVQRCKVRLAL
ncbi:hypothetical protein B0H19DRAFT_1144625 [Mycena capillaripes]|nr:hypothetical protein B0H19DRAFT_1144625 [Mycena capillaripes]